MPDTALSSCSPINRLAAAAERNKHLYYPLPTVDSIRVLEIHPAANGEPIVCSLSYGAPYSSVPPYHALSYCWGDISNTVSISCNGKPLSVTQGLLSALQALRQEKGRLRLWVDAIYINQHDIAERNSQVSIMRLIYSKAEQVDVWLGSGSKTTLMAVRTIETMAMEWCESAYGLNGSLSRSEYARRLQNEDDSSIRIPETALSTPPKPQDISWRAIVEYLGSPWFSRVWVIQEIQSCREAWVLCGSTRLEWEFVALVARWAHHQQLQEFIHPQSSSRGIQQAQTIRERLVTHRDIPFLYALVRARNSNSTDPRDKVISMLQHSIRQATGNAAHSMMFNTFDGNSRSVVSHLDLPVDYTMPLSDLYTEVAIRAITLFKSLEVLDYVQMVDAVSPLCPSWVPRWDLSTSYIPLPPPSFLFCASGDVPMSLSHVSAARLSIRGLRIDSISSMDNIFPVGQPSVVAGSGLHILDYRCRLGVDWPLAMSKLLTFDTSGGISDDERSLKRVSDNIDGHFADFSAFLVESLPNNPKKKFHIPLIRYWCDGCGQKLDCSVRLDGLAPSRWICSICNSFDLCQQCYKGEVHGSEHKMRYVAMTSILFCPAPGLWERFSINATTGNASRFRGKARAHTWSKCLFRTELGWVGMGPSSMRKQDSVVIFFGARIPFVVRNQDGHCHLVGPCYVHGLMDGEAIEMHSEGELSADDFVLI